MSILLEFNAQLPPKLTLTFHTDWQWQDIVGEMDNIRQQMDGLKSALHLVYHVIDYGNNPSNLIRSLANFSQNLPPQAREGLTVFVNANMYWKVCVTTFARVYPHLTGDIVFVSDLQAAQSAIRRKQEQIAELEEDEQKASSG
jgi:hypothetical protein